MTPCFPPELMIPQCMRWLELHDCFMRPTMCVLTAAYCARAVCMQALLIQHRILLLQCLGGL